MMSDVILAAVHLMERSGAVEFEIGWDCPHTPDVDDSHACADIVWNCHVMYRGHRIDHTADSPDSAALGLAMTMLRGATCRCGDPVSIKDDTPGCRWQLMGKRWEPGCNAAAIRVPGRRGDLPAMQTAMNRAQRRRRKRS